MHATVLFAVIVIHRLFVLIKIDKVYLCSVLQKSHKVVKSDFEIWTLKSLSFFIWAKKRPKDDLEVATTIRTLLLFRPKLQSQLKKHERKDFSPNHCSLV